MVGLPRETDVIPLLRNERIFTREQLPYFLVARRRSDIVGLVRNSSYPGC